MNSTEPVPTPPNRPVRLILIAQIVARARRHRLDCRPRAALIARHKLKAENRADSVIDGETSFRLRRSNPNLGTPLPAEVQAFIAGLDPRAASGYLKNWFVDIGDHVTNGQVLAEIETPELDQQLAQARAQLDQAQADLDLAKITADRWAELLKTASVSEQETAEKNADYALKQADVAAARANVQRLEELKNFDHVTAPFAGTITMRNTDIGQLITANSGAELFRLAQTDPLRVYVRCRSRSSMPSRPARRRS